MSSVAEIETAIDALPAAERDALEARWLARRFGLEALNDAERAELLASLDEAERDVDAGQSLSADALRGSLRQWVGR